MSSILEMIMMILFGLSWPINIYTAFKARSTKGTNVLFYCFIWLGYLCGLISKYYIIKASPDPWYVSVKWYVILIYVINMVMVSLGILIYFRNRRIDLKTRTTNL